MKFSLSGVFAPAVTPFDPTTREIDQASLGRNLEFLVASGLSGVVLFGSTGEGPMIDEEERRTAIALARSSVQKGLVMSGIAAESTRQASRMASTAADAGADAILVAPPSYFRPQLVYAAIRDHYLAIADASPVPILLYQVPLAYSGADLTVDLVSEIAQHPNVAGIKDSTGNITAIEELASVCPDEFSIIVGSGTSLHDGLGAGAVGGILAIANFAPVESLAILSTKVEGDDEASAALQNRLSPVHKGVVGRFGVAGVKYAMELIGQVGGAPREPLLPLDDQAKADIEEVMRDAHLLDPRPTIN